MKFFRNLFYPFVDAASGQFRLTVFVNGKANEMVVVYQTFDASKW